MKNRLQYETSPYLLQHAQNPVDWYPWGAEAFAKARAEDKPVFLSVGYSTCHWCHVMAQESFEDDEIAGILNRGFVSVKVDREERPDIDHIYMAACQAFTGSGGWPMSVFMTPDQKPFFAGTYFPPQSRGGMAGMRELLGVIEQAWRGNRSALLAQADAVVDRLRETQETQPLAAAEVLKTAVEQYKRMYDPVNGGFGKAPKFPAPHHLLFLMSYGRRCQDKECLRMAEHTLTQMYRGGLFDHVGFGFCRYSTDERFLIPHFEKMLYDNAWLILAYCQAHAFAQKPDGAALYLRIAEKTAAYILNEMTSPEGAFYSAQDADSEGEEGKYYLFEAAEIERILPPAAADAFKKHFGVSKQGNFAGRSIPNLLNSDVFDPACDRFLPTVYRYRQKRHALHTDQKVLTAWNAWMIAALCALYRASGKTVYLEAAKRADRFIAEKLTDGETLYASFAAGKRGAPGFLDDYAALCYAQLALYGAAYETEPLERAKALCEKTAAAFADEEHGGFYFSANNGERLIFRPKETDDGAVPSGNSVMAWNLVRLWQLTGAEEYRRRAEKQLAFLSGEAAAYPAGYGMFLNALVQFEAPPLSITVVPEGRMEPKKAALMLPPEAAVVFRQPSREFPLKNGKTTFYVCRGNTCLPPVNELQEALHTDARG